MARIQRMTRQRQAVLDALATLPHFHSSQQVHQALQNAGESVSLATVYRSLQTLTEMGQIDCVRSASGENLYRLCETLGHHHHVVCEKCSRVEEVDLGSIEPALITAAAAKGFQLSAHELELFGVCEDCRS